MWIRRGFYPLIITTLHNIQFSSKKIIKKDKYVSAEKILGYNLDALLLIRQLIPNLICKYKKKNITLRVIVFIGPNYFLFNSGQLAEISGSKKKLSSQSISERKKSQNISQEHFNICEFFVYHLFSQLKISPPVTFLIASNIPYGVFICAEEVSSNPFFSVMSSLDSQTQIHNNLLRSKKLKLLVTLLDLITRIFYLSDMNSGNFCLIHDNLPDRKCNFSKLVIIDFWINNLIENCFENSQIVVNFNQITKKFFF